MAVSWKWHRDHPQLGLHPGVDVRGAAAVSCPHVQEAAHHLINLEKKNPSLRPTITTSLESEVEFISQYQEVKTDNNDGKITFVLTHSHKFYIMYVCSPQITPMVKSCRRSGCCGRRLKEWRPWTPMQCSG